MSDDDDDRTLESMLVRIGMGFGVEIAHDLLHPGHTRDSELLERAELVAVEFERAGLHNAALAVRECLADVRAGTHRDPARGGDIIGGDIIEGVVRDIVPERRRLEG